MGESEVCVSGRVAPSLFVVGCEKCATTSLYSDMSDHFRQLDPGSTLLEGEDSDFLKSKHYFDTYYENGEEWYVSHYSNCSSEGLATESMAENRRLTSGGKVRVAGDFTPSYLENSESAKRIYKTYKDSGHETQLRFVNILRDPADRLFSYFVAGKADGTLDLTGFSDGEFTTACLEDPTDCSELQSLTFDDWVTVQLQRADDCVAAGVENLWPGCGSSGLFAGLYSLQVARFLKYFDAKQIAIVRYEAYSGDGPQLLKNLADWLELDFDRDGMTASSQLDVTSIDDDVDAAGMTDATRESLDTFYNPYTAQLYALMVKEGVTFIDVIEKKDLF